MVPLARTIAVWGVVCRLFPLKLTELFTYVWSKLCTVVTVHMWVNQNLDRLLLWPSVCTLLLPLFLLLSLLSVLPSCTWKTCLLCKVCMVWMTEQVSVGSLYISLLHPLWCLKTKVAIFLLLTTLFLMVWFVCDRVWCVCFQRSLCLSPPMLWMFCAGVMCTGS